MQLACVVRTDSVGEWHETAVAAAAMTAPLQDGAHIPRLWYGGELNPFQHHLLCHQKKKKEAAERFCSGGASWLLSLIKVLMNRSP